MKHGDDKPGRRVWFLAKGQPREGILLRCDHLGVVIKEDGGQRMWCSGGDTEGELWGFLEQARI